MQNCGLFDHPHHVPTSNRATADTCGNCGRRANAITSLGSDILRRGSATRPKVMRAGCLPHREADRNDNDVEPRYAGSSAMPHGLRQGCQHSILVLAAPDQSAVRAFPGAVLGPVCGPVPPLRPPPRPPLRLPQYSLVAHSAAALGSCSGSVMHVSRAHSIVVDQKSGLSACGTAVSPSA